MGQRRSDCRLPSPSIVNKRGLSIESIGGLHPIEGRQNVTNSSGQTLRQQLSQRALDSGIQASAEWRRWDAIESESRTLPVLPIDRLWLKLCNPGHDNLLDQRTPFYLPPEGLAGHAYRR